jgi:hypothetical protein
MFCIMGARGGLELGVIPYLNDPGARPESFLQLADQILGKRLDRDGNLETQYVIPG